jgi:hypothetical protein
MQHRWGDTDRGKPKYWEKPPFQRHFVQMQFYIFLGALSSISLMMTLQGRNMLL